jgi:hypothetical protein
VTDCNVSGSVTSSSSYVYDNPSHAGGIIGYNTDGTVTDCDASGSVTATSSTGPSYAGGVIGYLSSGTTTANTYATSTGQSYGIGRDYREAYDPVSGAYPPSNNGATPQ